MLRALWLIPLLWLVACASFAKSVPAKTPAPSAQPPRQPLLRLETGMHTAMVNRIAVDAAERFLVSASDDKTARVWDLATGKLLQTLRPPLGEGNEGKLYAVAIAPDGGTIALAGWTGYEWDGTISLYLFDHASGKLTRRLPGLPNVIHDLAYSPDGRYLAAALGSGGIRVYRTSDWQEVFQDAAYGADSYSVEFDRAGRLLTTCDDGLLRLYDADFHLIAKQAAPGGKQPFFARFSPDGSLVAVGFYDTPAVNLLSGKTLEFLRQPDTPAVGDNLGRVAWSADGRYLYAGGRYADAGRFPVLRWNSAGLGTAQQFRVSTSTIMDLRPLKDGRLAFGTGDPAIGLLQADGSKAWEQHGKIFDLRNNEDQRSNEDRLRVSNDGAVIEFGFNMLGTDGQWQRGKARFDVAEKSVLLNPTPLPSLAAPDTGGEDRSNWKNTLTPNIHGHALRLDDNERSRSLALAPHSKGFLLGTSYWLRYYDSPVQLRWETAIPGEAWAVNLSPDGRHAVVAFGDGTIRWFETTKGHEVLALYVHPDGKRWVAWTPEGFYAASPGAEAFVGYHLNQGADQAGEFVSAAQLAQTFLRPNLIARRLSADGDKLMADATRELGDVREVLKTQPPKVELLAVEPTDTPGEYRLKIHVDYRNGKPGEVSFSIDGKGRSEGRRPGSPGGFDTVLYKLPAGRHTVRLSAKNDLGVESALDDRAAEQTVDVPAYDDPPKLFMLAVGIHDYRDKSLNRGVIYAARDAGEVAERFRVQGKKLYQTVNVVELRDSQATGQAIRDALAAFAKQADVNDVFVLYLAGHGFAVDDEYHFVPWDDVKTSESAFRQNSLDEKTLVDALNRIKARKSLVLVDSCASNTLHLAGRGGDEKDAISRWAKLSGKAIIAATNSEAVQAREGQDHGYFTYALLEGLKGAADRGSMNGKIEVDELADYIEAQLPKISAQGGVEQFPWKDTQGASFTVLPKP